MIRPNVRAHWRGASGSEKEAERFRRVQCSSMVRRRGIIDFCLPQGVSGQSKRHNLPQLPTGSQPRLTETAATELPA